MKKTQKKTRNSRRPTDLDVIIVGAGIAGINTAYYLQTQMVGTSYAILEGRSRIGGTWDLFRYPGIRSDSDMTTFGFSWYPWTRPERLGAAEHIISYMQKSAAAFGIDENIRFNHKVHTADWSSASKSWTLIVADSQGKSQEYHAKFLVLGTGYYNYEHPLETTIPGLSNFNGPVIHPQFWPENLDYSGKDVVVIGSGATAVTLIPSLAEKAKSVTMLQRSPTYIIAQPTEYTESGLVKFIQRFLPAGAATAFKRLRFIVSGTLFYGYCMLFPARARRLLRDATVKQLPAGLSWDPHFNPRYNPWRQRLCLCPAGDFYAALRSGKAGVVTDTIDTVTAGEIRLASGRAVRPDIIVTATGLKLQFAGGVRLSVDGAEVHTAEKFTWKGSMIQDVPNLMFVMGYVNASWTLGAEVTAQHLVRLLRVMQQRGARVAVPRLDNPGKMQEKSVFNLSSGYVQSANQMFPRAGSGCWDHKRNYLLDILDAQFGSVTKGLSIE
ncbi:FAD/NAD(P)-binding domain-containing protein [Jackrogersella minutella]|nr:FAD/NAD(P)-binding domain-containing protein [Jackrogersella minutella]